MNRPPRQYPGAAAAIAAIVGILSAKGDPAMIEKNEFGKTSDGDTAHLYTLRNKTGAEARITDYGGIVVSLRVPDRNGLLGDVVLGYDALEDYIRNNPYFGCLVGRFGNRIAGGRFTLNEVEHTLAQNNGPNALHGGLKGFDKVLWHSRAYETEDGPALELKYLSRDGEEGYPGNLAVTAVYTWSDDNALRLEYTAVSDKDTIVNLTQHSYFNLAGEGSNLDHVVTLHADYFTPVDETMIPTGELLPVAGTPFDFTSPHAIGERINGDDEQLVRGLGYDHNWVLNKAQPGELSLAARVTEPTSGRVLEVLTTEPGMQFYTGNFLDGSITGKAGRVYSHRAGFCMEPQHFPDSPNQPQFPSTVLKAGATFQSTIVYRFPKPE